MYLAYVTLEPKLPTDEMSQTLSVNDAVVDVVTLVGPGAEKGKRIYRSEWWVVLNLSWSANGRLVIGDAPIEGAGRSGQTAVYDPDSDEIIIAIPGTFRLENWNPQRTAFFIFADRHSYGTCSSYLAGYDFVGERPLPEISPGTTLIMARPFWTADGQALILNTRDLYFEVDSQSMEVPLGPAEIKGIDLTAKELSIQTVEADPVQDILVSGQKGGSYEVVRKPFEPTACSGTP
jgi:hypothetical protein